MTDQTPGVGHNQGPAVDQFLERLREQHIEFIERAEDLELDSGKVPMEPASDEDVAKVNRWVTQARKLAREVEGERTTAKAPYLERSKVIDAFFNDQKKALLARADELERRSAPYLLAKQRQEEAAARERARLARVEQERRDAEAAAARKREQDARDERRREELRIAQEAEEREQREAAAKGPTAQEIAAEEERAAKARQRLEDAARAEEKAAKETERREKEARQGAVAADRAEARAERGGELGRTQGGGGAAKVEMVWVPKVTSLMQLIQSMGPIGRFVDMRWLDAPLARAAKMPERPDIPGVEWVQETAVKTAATRGN